MEALKILVVEDEMILAQDICRSLTNMGYKTLEPVIGFTEAQEALKSNDIDLALLDITLAGQKNGIELAAYIREYHNMPIIFLTSHSDSNTVQRAKEVKPNGYLVKPPEESALYVAIESAMANFLDHGRTDHAKPIENAIFIKVDHLYIKVMIEDILWLKSDGNYIDVVTDSKTFPVRSSFANLIQDIGSKNFLQVHKSYYVNLQKLEAVNHTSLLINNIEIPIGRNFREDLYSSLKRFA